LEKLKISKIWGAPFLGNCVFEGGLVLQGLKKPPPKRGVKIKIYFI
jgi:hypothetical protein